MMSYQATGLRGSAPFCLWLSFHAPNCVLLDVTSPDAGPIPRQKGQAISLWEYRRDYERMGERNRIAWVMMML